MDKNHHVGCADVGTFYSLKERKHTKHNMIILFIPTYTYLYVTSIMNVLINFIRGQWVSFVIVEFSPILFANVHVSRMNAKRNEPS